MLTEWPMVGRDTVLRRLVDALLDRRTRSPIVVHGLAGVGKTRLLSEALDRVAGMSSSVVQVVGSTAEAEIPFGAVAHLLPADVDDGDRLALLRGAMAALTSQIAADGAVVVLAVDDAQWLDEGSAAVVHRAATLAGLQLVMTVCDGAGGSDVITRLATASTTVRIELAPLTMDEVGTLLAEVLGGPAVTSSARRLAHLSEGNPLWLRELVRASRRHGVLRHRAGLWRLDGEPVEGGSLSDAVRATIDAFDADVRAVVAAVALADTLGVEVLERLFGDRGLDAADALGLLAPVPDRRRVQVRLSHPMYGEVVLADLPPVRARRLRLQLADAVEAAGGRRRRDLLRMARWRLDAGDRSNPDLLTAAAHAAGGATAHRLAARFARAAVDAGGGFAARIALGEALQRTGRTDEAVAELHAAAASATASEERVRAHALRADVLFWTQRFAEAEDALRTADAAADTAGGLHRIAVQRALFANTSGHLAAAVALADAALADPSISPRTRADAAYVVSHAAPPCGRPGWAVDVIDRAGADLAGQFELDYGYSRDVLLPARALACWWAWRFDEVKATSKAALVSLPDSDHSALWISWVEGLVALTRGRLRRAGRLFAHATKLVDHVYPDSDALGDVRCVTRSTLSEAAALVGDRATAARALASAERAWPADMLVPYRATARVWTAAVHGDAAAARRHAIGGAARAREVGAHLLEARLRHDLVRLGDPVPAAPRLDELADVVEVPHAALYAAHARGLADGDAVAVRRAADGFEAAGVLLLAAEAHAHRANLLTRKGRPRAAAGARTAARRLASRCDGARTLALTFTSGPHLTPREHEIALLAAGGLSDRQIAERLRISPRTVSTHLHRCYTKLGISRRTELRDVIG